MLKSKENEMILKVVREMRYVIFKGLIIRFIVNFLFEIMDVRRWWNYIFRGLKEKKVGLEFFIRGKYF